MCVCGGRHAAVAELHYWEICGAHANGFLIQLQKHENTTLIKVHQYTYLCLNMLRIKKYR